MTIEGLLREHGPILSSLIVDHLVQEGLSPATARQRISRARGNVERLSGLTLPNREQFLYLKDQYGTSRFYARLTQAIEYTHSAYARALRGLAARRGSTPLEFFPIASGLAIQPSKAQATHESVTKSLQEVRLLDVVETSAGSYVQLLEPEASVERRRAAVFVEDIALAAVGSWLAKIGWSSTGTLQVRKAGKLPQIGPYAFDLTGPCYLSALSRRNPDGIVPGFVAADIWLDHVAASMDLWPFFAKVDSLLASQKHTKLQPAVIVDGLTEDALMLLRKRGVLIARPSTLFGEDVGSALRELIGVIQNAAAAVVSNPEKVFELLKNLVRLEGVALNMRGKLLEFVTAHLYSLEGYKVDMGQTIRDAVGKRAEIDVKAMRTDELVCVECKGVGPEAVVGVETIQDWYNRVVPRVKYWMRQSEGLPPTRRFEFVSSTDYSGEAHEFIGSLPNGQKNYSIAFLSGKDILARLERHRQTAVLNMFREQFCA